MIPIQIHSAEKMKQIVQIAIVMVLLFCHDQRRSANQINVNNSADSQAIGDRNPKRFTNKYVCAHAKGPMVIGKQAQEAIEAIISCPISISKWGAIATAKNNHTRGGTLWNSSSESCSLMFRIFHLYVHHSRLC